MRRLTHGTTMTAHFWLATLMAPLLSATIGAWDFAIGTHLVYRRLAIYRPILAIGQGFEMTYFGL